MDEGGFPGVECAEVAPAPRLGILAPGIEPILAGSQLPNHANTSAAWMPVREQGCWTKRSERTNSLPFGVQQTAAKTTEFIRFPAHISVYTLKQEVEMPERETVERAREDGAKESQPARGQESSYGKKCIMFASASMERALPSKQSQSVFRKRGARV
jgi:hypothetical protein